MSVIVAGGGLGGAAVALRLARAGVAVTVLERDRAPKPKVCGEFLSTTALDELARLGVDPVAIGAVPLDTAVLSAGRHTAAIPLPFPAASFSREKLDAHLLDLAEEAGAAVRRGVTIRAADATGVETAGERLRAAAVVLATGKHDVRGHGRGAGRQAGYVGLKRYAVLTSAGRAALGGSVAVALLPGGYAGVEAVEDGRANVCLAVRAEQVRRLGVEGVFATLPAASAHVGDILAGALWDGPTLAVGRVPYGFVREESGGLYAVGDQVAVIPSIFGEGMGIALSTARLAAEAILGGEDAAAATRRQAALAGRVVRRATFLAGALTSRAGRLAPRFAATFPAAAARIARATRLPGHPHP